MDGDILNWPDWADRTPPEERSDTSKFDYGFRETKSELRGLMDRMGVDKWHLSDVTGSHGDPGVVVRWENNGTPHAVACDKYQYKGDNLREAYLWIKHERTQGNRPVKTGQDQMAAAQLPSGNEDEPAVAVGNIVPEDVLGVKKNANQSEIKNAYRERVKEAHPDTGDGGDAVELQRVKAAHRMMTED